MKVLRAIVWIALSSFVFIQFIPIDRNEDKVIYTSDFIMVNKVPTNIAQNLKTACYDCHSNNIQYPWYSRIQPITWFMENHVEEGKAELNFNEWSDYLTRRMNSKLSSIISLIEDNEMPLDSYTLIHRDALLSKIEKAELINYMDGLKMNL